ncbi:MAG: twin-arginine translocation signal domain-containing protein, partial [Planctomycetota bacterium]
MARINRRKFLRLGVSGLAAGALGPALPWPLLRRGLHAASLGTTPKKM